MKNIRNYLLCILMMMLLCFILSCEIFKPNDESSPICFTIDGHDVTIKNFWNNDESHTENLRGITSFDQTVSRNNETHNLEWTNIASDNNMVYSFNVKIDGKDYSYPKDKCGWSGQREEITFKLNDVSYRYIESYGSRSYPYGDYNEAYDYTPEQYSIIGSKTTADGEAHKNTIIVSFINYDGWYLSIFYYDENGNYIYFHGPDIDISILENRDTIGEQMSASIPGPIISYDSTMTLSDLSFLVERIYTYQSEPTQFLTHNTENLEVSIFENGNIGHLYAGNIGNGVKFMGSVDALWTAGFIIGTASRGSVNGHIGSFGVNYDLINSEPISGFESSPPHWDQVAEATFDHGWSSTPYYIYVTQISSSNTGENFMFIHYNLLGYSSTLSDLFVGIFADWDVGGIEAYDSNLGGYDADRNMAYQYVSDGTNDPNYYGIIALSGMSGSRVTTEGDYESIRDSSFTWISTFLNEPITSPGDYRMWIGSGPFDLSVYRLDVYFAIVAGTDLNDLNVNADAAIQKYNSIFPE